MSDVARFLPLSQRSRSDDDAVVSDRRGQLAEVVRTAGAALASTPDALQAFVREAGLDERDAADVDIPALATRIENGPKRTTRDLVRAVRALLSRVDGDVALSSRITGTIAMHASTTAPYDRRAVIGGHTVRASDAEWTIGRGPELVAPAQQIVAFLLGLSDAAPRRPVS